jgi:hypothetical protein
MFHVEEEPEGVPHSEDKVELGVAHVDGALEDEAHSVEVALGVDGEDEALDHSPHCEEVELGVGPELDGVEGQELVAVVNGEDQASVCVSGSLLTTPPSAGLIRARQKNVAFTIVRERLREVLRLVVESVASRGKRGCSL